MRKILRILILTLTLVTLNASGIETCRQVLTNLPANALLLGQGAGGQVFLILSQFGSYVKKQYYTQAGLLNDQRALSALSKLQERRLLNQSFSIVQPANIEIAQLGPFEMNLQYHSGATAYELMTANNPRAKKIRLQYEQRLKSFDQAILKNLVVLKRSEFSLYGATAIHYELQDFQIVIHTKNILISKNDFVLIDPF